MLFLRAVYYTFNSQYEQNNTKYHRAFIIMYIVITKHIKEKT